MQQTTSAPISVQPVADRRTLQKFIDLPYRLHADDPNWIAPLRFEQKHRYSDKNPFFEHAHWQAWIACRGSTVVGRISAQVDDLSVDPSGDKLGFFGCIEAEDDAEVFALLFRTAEAWLQAEGADRVRGPFNLSINEECGLLIDGFDRPPYIMMGHAPRSYAARIEEQGYAKARDLYAYEVVPDFDAPPAMRRVLERLPSDITVRKFDSKKRKQELEVLRDIFNDSWSGNWGFVPFTTAEFDDIGQLLTLLIDDEFIQIAELQGRPVAMIVAIPDVNRAIADLGGRLLPFGWAKLLWRLKVRRPNGARVMLMGVRREFHRDRLGRSLALLVIDTVRRHLVEHGIDKVEMSWVLEDNEGMKGLAEAFGGNLYKRYRIFEKTLQRGPA